MWQRVFLRTLSLDRREAQVYPCACALNERARSWRWSAEGQHPWPAEPFPRLTFDPVLVEAYCGNPAYQSWAVHRVALYRYLGFPARKVWSVIGCFSGCPCTLQAGEGVPGNLCRTYMSLVGPQLPASSRRYFKSFLLLID